MRGTRPPQCPFHSETTAKDAAESKDCIDTSSKTEGLLRAGFMIEHSIDRINTTITPITVGS